MSGSVGRFCAQALPRFEAPAGLRSAVLKMARPAAPTESTKWGLTNYFGLWAGTVLAAAVVLAAGTGYIWGMARSRTDALVQEAVGDHIRSLQLNHLSDVISTDQHTVKPWFVGKLDFSPPVFDLAVSGFPLSGGRLEHLDGRPAAALVYHRRQHAINLFIWPASERPVSNRQSAQNGFQTRSWSERGFNFLAVSEIDADELGRFTTAYRDAEPH